MKQSNLSGGAFSAAKLEDADHMPTLPKLPRRPRPLDPHELAVSEMRFVGEMERAHSIEEHLRQREDLGWQRILAEDRAEHERRQQGAAARAWVAQLSGGAQG